MVIIVMTITIIDYNRSITQLSILYIHAEPNEKNKEKGGDDQEKKKKITKEEQDQTKDKEKDMPRKATSKIRINRR